MNEKKLAVRTTVGTLALEGDLTMPQEAAAIVLLVHGSGSGQDSCRDRRVASVLNQARFATLLLKLRALDEERFDARTTHLRQDVELLARRLVRATDWLVEYPDTRHLPVGYFAASIAAAAALMAATERLDIVRAVVSRSGWPDLAGPTLIDVHAPTLLIVGEKDSRLMELNRAALAQLRCEKELVIIQGATHLFEEPGAFSRVTRSAQTWFEDYLF